MSILNSIHFLGFDDSKNAVVSVVHWGSCDLQFHCNSTCQVWTPENMQYCEVRKAHGPPERMNWLMEVRAENVISSWGQFRDWELLVTPFKIIYLGSSPNRFVSYQCLHRNMVCFSFPSPHTNSQLSGSAPSIMTYLTNTLLITFKKKKTPPNRNHLNLDLTSSQPGGCCDKSSPNRVQ